jgi:hypothetical protein
MGQIPLTAKTFPRLDYTATVKDSRQVLDQLRDYFCLTFILLLSYFLFWEGGGSIAILL